ncbi:MAG: tetratricopeptide repeat protein [Candidatus Aegiribacteria sp.]|nr:tetratricopeptide repeat protein [Candidatus Aegiribacteria sp.]
MLNLIPRFIHDKYRDGEIRGRFETASVFIDIVGFTALTGGLMKRGKEGAELISDIINRVYSPFIEKVYHAGGFVSAFAGDSFTALFPSGSTRYVENVVLDIKNDFDSGRDDSVESSYRSDLNIRIGISFGEVDWGIVGSALKTFYFRGEPITESARIIDTIEPGNIAIHGYDSGKLPRNTSDKIITDTCTGVGARPSQGRMRRSILEKFVPDHLPKFGLAGEFRDVAAVFTAFRGYDNYEYIDHFISRAVAVTSALGGYPSGLFFDDKGPHMLILFGAPKSYENNTKRAIDFAMKLRDEFGSNVKSGLTHGIAYVGVVGSRRRCTYTALGDKINLSARLMSCADWESILISGELETRIASLYKTSEFASLHLKGIKERVPTYRIVSRFGAGEPKLFEGSTVGRDREIAKLEEQCRPIYSGSPGGVVYVYGEAGIGKSRLIYDLGQRETKAKSIVLQTDSILRKSMNPFVYGLRTYFGQSDSKTGDENRAAFADIFDKLITGSNAVGGDRSVRDRVNELLRVKSILGALVGLTWESSLYEELDAEGRFSNTLFAIKELIKAESLMQPVILFLEDLHWIDEDSRRVFSTLTRNLAGYPIIVIATSRLNDDGSRPFLELDHDVKCSEVIVEHLSSDIARAFIAKQFDRPISDGAISFVIRQTGGNPFYIEQFCRYLIENEMLTVSEDEYHLSARDIDIPTGIRAILVARIDRLSRELQDMIRTASVLGREFETSILSRMMRILEDSSVNANYLLLLQEGENNAIWSAVNEILYIFKHALLRDTVYDMQLRKRLRELHGTAALALQKYYGSDETRYADIAFHYENAEIPGKAVHFLRKAADYAKREYKNEQYLAHSRHLLAFTKSDEEKAAINFEIAITLINSGEWESATAIFEDITRFARTSDNSELLAKNLNKLGWLYLNSGNPDEAEDTYRKALQISEEIIDLHGQSESLYGIGTVATHKGEYEDALRLSARSRAAAERINDRKKVANAVQLMGKIHSRAGNLEKGTECYEEFLKISRESSDKYDICTGLSLLGLNTEEMGNPDKALVLYDEAIGIAKELGSKKELARSYNNKAIVYEKQGNYPEAHRFYTSSYDISLEMGDVVSSSISLMNIANINGKLGKLDEALDILDRVLALGDGMDEQNRSFAVAIIGAIHCSRGEFGLAVKHLQQAEDIAWNIGVPMLAALFITVKISALLELKRFEEAARNIERALPIVKEGGDTETAAMIDILQAEVTAHFDRDEGVAKMTELINGFTDTKELAEAYYRLYRVSGEEGHRQEAIRYREELINLLPEYSNRVILEYLELRGNPLPADRS